MGGLGQSHAYTKALKTQWPKPKGKGWAINSLHRHAAGAANPARSHGNSESSSRRHETNCSGQKTSEPYAPQSMFPIAPRPSFFSLSAPVPAKPDLLCPTWPSTACCLLLAVLFSRPCPQLTLRPSAQSLCSHPTPLSSPVPVFFFYFLFFSPGLGPDPSLPHKTLNRPGQPFEPLQQTGFCITPCPSHTRCSPSPCSAHNQMLLEQVLEGPLAPSHQLCPLFPIHLEIWRKGPDTRRCPNHLPHGRQGQKREAALRRYC